MQNNWRGRLPCQLIRKRRYSNISISWLRFSINHKTGRQSPTRRGTREGHPNLRSSQAKCTAMWQVVYQMGVIQSCSRTQRMPAVFYLTFIWQLRAMGKLLWLQDRSKCNHSKQRQQRGLSRKLNNLYWSMGVHRQVRNHVDPITSLLMEMPNISKEYLTKQRQWRQLQPRLTIICTSIMSKSLHDYNNTV